MDRSSPSPPADAAGDRIQARPVMLTRLTVDDAEDMVTVLADELLYRFTGGTPPTHEELAARYRRQVAGRSADGRQEWRNWIIRDGAGHAVGYIQATFSDSGSRAEIGWVIGLAWQGRGYATAAARALVNWLDARGVQHIQAHIHPDHAASAAVARQAGLAPTGVIEDGEERWQRDLSSGRWMLPQPGGCSGR